MKKRKISIALLSVIALSVSITVASTTLKVYADSESVSAVEQIDNDTLILDSQQIAEAFDIQISQPRLIEYLVKAGDTVETVANTYAIKVSTITVSNGISANTALQEGQSLVFPSIDGIAYKIKDGENLWDLASLYKIDFYDLLEINNLGSPDKLKLGQKIILPGVEALKTEAKAESKKADVKASSKTVSRGGIWPVSGSVTSRYGARWGKQHEGIDIAVSTGTNVKAYADGKVTYSGWQSGYGNVVIISHSNGLQTYYGHNSKLLVKDGQRVSVGDIIAKSGNTGRSTGPHVHFEVRKNGAPVNPFSYLR
ncbi:peptidoglycan DD-metalloendopeptidase family protein [Clostridium swellfunianum]|uniref:M23 family metallopeptidase n=1 Tax=Clostridium swellfunianum TaxID=1367462 RepID=UPI0020301380|nr:M23 family metallopeptidase [Clostridium swellfunianum]MCM0650699.1 peptidoglycan DD-metalloendopeptidase family protein [Clostridium swellfunianum]